MNVMLFYDDDNFRLDNSLIPLFEYFKWRGVILLGDYEQFSERTSDPICEAINFGLAAGNAAQVCIIERGKCFILSGPSGFDRFEGMRMLRSCYNTITVALEANRSLLSLENNDNVNIATTNGYALSASC